MPFFTFNIQPFFSYCKHYIVHQHDKLVCLLFTNHRTVINVYKSTCCTYTTYLKFFQNVEVIFDNSLFARNQYRTICHLIQNQFAIAVMLKTLLIYYGTESYYTRWSTRKLTESECSCVQINRAAPLEQLSLGLKHSYIYLQVQCNNKG